MQTEEALRKLPPNEWFFWRRPPGLLYHAGVVLLCCGLLWAHSVPGFNVVLLLAVAPLVVLAVLLWIAS